ncbi:e3 ubiquitin-protein ligase MIB1-like protein, partial [Aphelenchoides avenae]
MTTVGEPSLPPMAAVHLGGPLSVTSRRTAIPPCRVCSEKPSDTVVVPCGHLSTCWSCTLKRSSCAQCFTSVRTFSRVPEDDLKRYLVENCWICGNHKVNSVIPRCGHMYMCETCGSDALRGGRFSCLICDGFGNDVLPVSTCTELSPTRMVSAQRQPTPTVEQACSSVAPAELNHEPQGPPPVCHSCDDTRTANALMYPCGHVSTCLECSTGRRYCPACHKRVSRVVRLFAEVSSGIASVAGSDECQICATHGRKMAFFPCGHTNVCGR